jgi:hypothetical protein
MKLYHSVTLASIVFSLPQFANATPNCSACGILHAPGPEIGDGVVGFAVAATVVLGLLMLPRIKRLFQTKSA